MPAATDPIAAALVMNMGDLGMPNTEIERRTGIAERTAWDIVNRHGRWGEIAGKPEFTKLREAQNRTLEALSRKMCAESWAYAADKMDKASYYQLVMGGAILLDKSRLLAGESTENIAHLHVHEVRALDWIAERLQGRLAKIDENKG